MSHYFCRVIGSWPLRSAVARLAIFPCMDRTCEERLAGDRSDEGDPDSTEVAARIRDTPEDIVLEAPASGLAFHPARDLLAAGDVDGDVFV